MTAPSSTPIADAPISKIPATYWIPDGIVERFRVLSPKHEFAYKQDEEVARALNARMLGGLKAIVRDGRSPESKTLVVRISVGTNGHALALCRPRSGSGPRCPIGAGTSDWVVVAIVTLLTGRQNVEHEQWKPWDDNQVLSLSHVLKLGDPTPAPNVSVTPPKPAPKAVEPEDDDTPAHVFGGSRSERAAYAMKILRERPGISGTGPDSLYELVKRKFGTGMSGDTMAELRQRVEQEQRRARARAEAATTVKSIPPPAPAPAPAPAPVSVSTSSPSSVPGLADLPNLITAERVAREAYMDAARVWEATKTQLDNLLAQMGLRREQG